MTTLVTPGIVSPSANYHREPYHCPTDSQDDQFLPINQTHNGCDERRDMDDDEEMNKEGEEAEDEEEDDDEDEDDKRTVTSEDAGETRVKNKRKNFQPRSIVTEVSGRGERNRRKGVSTPQKCLKPKVMDLCVRENDETDSDNSENSKATFNLKNYRKTKSKCHDEEVSIRPQSLLSLLNSENRLNNPFGIDLSKFNRRLTPNAVIGKTAELADLALSAMQPPQPGEASAMKEYAENTMRELLSIYGLSSNEVSEPITKNVDISNFSAGKILEKCETGRTVRHPCSPLSQPPTPPHTPLSPFHLKTRRCESPTDEEPEAETLEQFRARMNAEVNLSSRAMFPHNLSLSSSLNDSHREFEDGDSPPPHHSTILVEPKGARHTSSPNRDKTIVNIDYSRYVKRYSSSGECGSSYCKDLNYREHFHCLDCTARVFIKKEEMIRHFKWHKKRDESLQHGFLRYSPMDDCSEKYSNCQHNRKQTHYHCVHEGCDKTYISTSDVQMHANYHRKDSAIIQEGFQRFRATEECLTTYCAFYGQRTTHFHCRRENCQFTFKNKADMEKHKTYHVKDEQLARDGFKKFMKNENCGYESCRFSRISNHIHCIRPNCSYVLHSSGQLLSHKRKHERKDSELAYRKFKLTQSVMRSLQDGVPLNLEQIEAAALDHSQTSNGEYSSDGGPSSPPILPPGFHRFGIHGNYDALPQPHFMLQPPGLQALQKMQMENLHKLQELDGAAKYHPKSAEMDGAERNYQMTLDLMEKFPELVLKTPELLHKLPELLQRLPPEMRTPESLKTLSKSSEDRNSSIASSDAGDAGPMDLSNDRGSEGRGFESRSSVTDQPDEIWNKYLRPFSATEPCIDGSSCEDAGKDHFHCVSEGCRIVFRTKDAVREHGCNHAEQDRVTGLYFVTTPQDTTCQTDGDCELRSKHYHCTWEGCREVLLPSDSPFQRLDHIKQHEITKRHSVGLPAPHLASSLDAMFRRKRGRPPKNRIIEVWNDNSNQNGPPGLSHDSPQAIFTSFKLPKASLTPSRPLSAVFDLNRERPSSPAHENNSRGSSPIHLEGFLTQDSETCAEIGCRLTGHHLHCSHPRCIFASDRSIYITQHREFHERVEILELFVCYDKRSDCRSNACLHNKNARHFHCLRPGCNFSFLRSSTMILHDDNHSRHGEGEIPLTRELEHEQAVEGDPEIKTEPSSPGSPAKLTVKAAGTFYPLSSFLSEENNKPSCGSKPHRAIQQSPENLCKKEESVTPEPKIVPASPSKLFPPNQSHNFILNPNFGAPGDEAQTPLSKLMRLQNEAARNMRDIERKNRESEPSSRDVMPEYMALERHVRYGPNENCSRPFCKLKRKDHFHCNACNQAFSEVDRLRHHIARHSSGAMSPGLKREPEDNNNEESIEDGRGSAPVGHGMPNYDFEGANPFSHPFGGFPLPPSLNAAAFAQQLNLMQGQGMLFQPSALYSNPGLMFGAHGLHPHHPLANGLHPMLDMEQAQAMHHHLTSLSLAATPGKRRSHTPPPLADLTQEAKKARVQNSMRILKDEPVPEGYVRYRFNEDCKYPHCGYREHQTHFHCMRKDCGYSFCDKTRFVQHTARHERLDTLMGGDFQQYRANVSCSRPDCVYASSIGSVQNKASHFHCIKCDFVCTDTNKVVAHRRQHQKLDSINAAGFEKYTPSQACSTEGCSHSGKQTHYHCLSCQYAVLGLSQMSAHKYRHLDEDNAGRQYK